MEKLPSLKTTISDGRKIQDFVIQFLDVRPENIHLLATEADADNVIKHVRVGDKESNYSQFFEEAADKVQREKWSS